MKRNLLAILLFGALVSGFYGCKKKDLTDPVSTGFIQFKMDGQLYHFYDYNTPEGSGSVSISDAPGKHSLTVSFGVVFANNAPSQNVTLVQNSADSLQIKNYIYSDTTNIKEQPQFNQILNTLDHYTFINKVTTGNIEVTRLDTIAGGKVEGTFNFKNLYLENQYNGVISTYHNVTEGQFSVVVDAK